VVKAVKLAPSANETTARRGGGMRAVTARREYRRPCVPHFAEDGDGLTAWLPRSARAAVERVYAAESCLL